MILDFTAKTSLLHCQYTNPKDSETKHFTFNVIYSSHVSITVSYALSQWLMLVDPRTELNRWWSWWSWWRVCVCVCAVEQASFTLSPSCQLSPMTPSAKYDCLFHCVNGCKLNILFLYRSLSSYKLNMWPVHNN